MHHFCLSISVHLTLEVRLLRDGQNVGVSMTSSFGDVDGGRDRLEIGSVRKAFSNASFGLEHLKAHAFVSTVCQQQNEAGNAFEAELRDQFQHLSVDGPSIELPASLLPWQCFVGEAVLADGENFSSWGRPVFVSVGQRLFMMCSALCRFLVGSWLGLWWHRAV